MDGYHHLRDDTAKAFTDDRWLRTGDVGEIDSDGFLFATGRIKDMFKTSNGKYIAPPAIEAKFMAICPYASPFMVFGEAHKHCVALIASDADLLSTWARENGPDGLDHAELVSAPAVRHPVDEYVSKLNAELNRWETVKKWELLDHDLSIERGELTPSLKVKRAAVTEQNEHILDGLYTDRLPRPTASEAQVSIGSWRGAFLPLWQSPTVDSVGVTRVARARISKPEHQ